MAHADYGNVMMAMETRIDNDGVHGLETKGTDEEMAALKQSAEHLAAMIAQVAEMGIIPSVADWATLNPNL